MDVSGAVKAYLIANCNFKDTWFHILLAIILYVPTALIFVFLGVSYYTKQLFYLIMSLALTFDWALNTFISGWVQEAPPMATCGQPRAFPSFMLEHSSFMYSYLMLSNHYFKLHLTTWDVFLLQFWVLLTWIASTELGYNNYRQAIFGALIGHVMAFLFVFFLDLFIRPLRNYVHHRGFLHFLGYYDNIFVDEDNHTSAIKEK
jgi:hypothetical protein